MAQKNRGYFTPIYDTMMKDPKTKRLLANYGMQGIGCYLTICTLMRSYETSNEECKELSFMIPYSDIPLIAKEFRMTSKKLHEIVGYCINNDLFKSYNVERGKDEPKKESIEPDFFYSEEILNNYFEWEDKRTKQSEGGKKGANIKYNKEGENEYESNTN